MVSFTDISKQKIDSAFPLKELKVIFSAFFDMVKNSQTKSNSMISNRNEKEKLRNSNKRSCTTKNSAILQKNTLKKIKSCNNKEYIIKISINII